MCLIQWSTPPPAQLPCCSVHPNYQLPWPQLGRRTWLCHSGLGPSMDPLKMKDASPGLKHNAVFLSYRLAKDSLPSLNYLHRPLGHCSSCCLLQDHIGHSRFGIYDCLTNTVPECNHKGKQLLLPGRLEGGWSWRQTRKLLLNYAVLEFFILQNENKKKRKTF